MPKMTESELSAILASEERAALGYLGGALSEARKKAMNYYLGEPFGNEMQDRSQVVSTDVADTVEWILPGLVKIFTASDDVVEFQPTGPEDEESAKQASDWCNWVALRDNPGFTVMYEAMKDALLQKTGIIKAWQDSTPTYKHQTFYGIPQDSLQLLKAQEALGEITIESETPVEPDPTQEGQSFYDVEIRKVKSNGRARIEAVPPEEFLISRRARDIETAHYVGHRKLRTQSDLIEDGYDREIVETLTSEYEDLSGESATRYKDIDENQIGSPSDKTDKASREVWVTESYILIDYDGDGIAERRKVTHAGNGKATILTIDGKPDNEEWEGPVPFAVLTPILMPHRVIGRSVADLVMDLQLIKSTVMRQMLDNSYLINNKGHVYDPMKVETEDLLVSRPGRNVRTKNGADPATALAPIEYQSITGDVYPLLEYLDTVREGRTGVSRASQGLDADVLAKSTAHAVSQITTAAAARVELIARVFAETGIKRLFKLLLWLACTYQDKPRVIKLRNKWIPIDPTEWDEEMDVQINVGLGTGNRDSILAHLAMLGNSQQLIVAAQGGMEGPLVKPENIHALFTKQIENAGFKNPNAFVSDPTDPNNPPPQPKPDPKMMEAQGRLQIEQLKAQGEQQKNQAQLEITSQQAHAKLQQSAAIEIQRMQQAHATETMKAQHAHDAARTQAQIDIERMNREMEIRHAEMVSKTELAREEMILRMQLEREKAAAEAHTDARKVEGDISAKHEQVKAQAQVAAAPPPKNELHDHLLKEVHGLVMDHHKKLSEPPKKRVAVAHRGADGRITHAELVEQ